MPINLKLFTKVEPEKLASLSRGENSKLSVETISSLIEECSRKMSNRERLTIPELNLMVTFYDKIGNSIKDDFLFYIEKYLGSNDNEDFSVFESFDELFPVSFLKRVYELPYITKTLNTDQSSSFKLFLSGMPPAPSGKGSVLIPYLQNLKISRMNGFTKGQIRHAKAYIDNGDFSDVLENKFELLISFLENLHFEGPPGIAKFLDEQVGKQLRNDPKGVRVKVLNENLGYFKYQRYVAKNNLAITGLPNLIKLRQIVVDLNQAIRVLSEQESKRGIFWQSIFDQMDGLEIQRDNVTTNYKVAIAFYVTRYVICDFGPSGNAIHIYDRDVFDSHIKHKKDWKQAELTTASLGPRKINHLGNWENDVRNLINRARR